MLMNRSHAHLTQRSPGHIHASPEVNADHVNMTEASQHMTGISWQQQCKDHQVSIVDLEKCDVL